MQISDAGLQFIIGFEGVRHSAYDDGGPGIGNCTIGVGHLLHLGPCTTQELSMLALTDDQVLALLRVDVARFEEVVNNRAKIKLNQNQYDALVDFCFNTGGGYPRVWAAVNSGDDVAGVLATTAITPAWATAALVRRRKAEGALYNEPVCEPEPVEEIEDMKPFLCLEEGSPNVWLIGFLLPILIGSASEAASLTAALGPAQIALSKATIDQMKL